MSVTLEVLSPSQREVYDLLAQGKTPTQIVNSLDSTLGVINAQITRIRNKGLTLPGEEGEKPLPTLVNPAHVEPQKVFAAPQERPLASGPSSNDQIASQLQNAGTALTPDQLSQLASKVGGSFAKDIHPMVLMGVTIQFVKLCGGRMTAHQVIEDVYSALRGFAGDGKPVPGDDGETKPLPQTEGERLKLLEEQNAELRKRLEQQKSSQGGYGGGYR